MKLFNPYTTTWYPLLEKQHYIDDTGAEATRDVPIPGAQISVGFIPHGIMKGLKLKHSIALSRYNTLISRIRAEDRMSSPFTREEAIEFSEITAEFEEFRSDVIRWAVRGHDGFFAEDGSPLPFTTATEQLNGVAYTVVGPETLQVYRLNSSVAETMASIALRHNKLPEGILGK